MTCDNVKLAFFKFNDMIRARSEHMVKLLTEYFMALPSSKLRAWLAEDMPATKFVKTNEANGSPPTRCVLHSADML
ncbi:hypothetical protein GGF41_006199, partial [Coemansia sp. RSA 2531]